MTVKRKYSFNYSLETLSAGYGFHCMPYYTGQPGQIIAARNPSCTRFAGAARLTECSSRCWDIGRPSQQALVEYQAFVLAIANQ